jgi:hypothetical protein
MVAPSTPARHRARKRVLKQIKLGFTADERGGDARQRLPAVERGNGAKRWNRTTEAAELQRPDVSDFDPAVGQPPGTLAHQDLARPGRLLQAGGDVHGLPGGEGGVGLVDHDLAGLDPDAGLEADLSDVTEDPQPGTDRPLRVVLVGQGNAEGGHNRVPGELLHRPAVGLDAVGHAVEVPGHVAPGDLGILALDELGRGDQIDEQNGGEFALHSQILGTAEGVTEGRLQVFAATRVRTGDEIAGAAVAMSMVVASRMGARP